jgi:hypothetical protein
VDPGRFFSFLIYLFTHYTSVHKAIRLLSPSVSTAIIRCHYLLKLFRCVARATSRITCKCDICHLK